MSVNTFLIHMSSIMDQCNQSGPPSVRLANFSNSYIPVMLVSTTDFYHFMPVSVTLKVTVGHKVSGQQNLFTLF